LQATRHPLVCVLFVLPLLLAYELGMSLAGADTGQSFRNGADIWLRDALAQIGAPRSYAAPAIILVILLAWGLWRRQPLPRDLLGANIGMALESTLFAGGLFGLSQLIFPLLVSMERAGFVSLDSRAAFLATGLDPTCQRVLCYFGAGLYEETLFRLVLFSAFFVLLLHWDMAPGTAFLAAGLGSAFCFAGAHHIGPHGEPFQGLVFLFRTLAGGYFACIFFFRGFGIAVGAHALYDVLVGVLLVPLTSGP